jgi:hypothetical protein
VERDFPCVGRITKGSRTQVRRRKEWECQTRNRVY